MTPGTAPRMLAVAGLALALQSGAIRAERADDGPPPVPDVSSPLDEAPPAPPQEPAQEGALDELVAPIALYPDPLVALILPASTMPEDLSAAQAYLVQYGDATRIDRQPWDASVRGLAHYPAVLTWLLDNAAWTQALGEAFLASPPDVMASIQRMRARALAEGVLASTPQQRVFTEGGMIEILPEQPDSIFVPEYDADAMFAPEAGDFYAGPPINYGSPCDVGPWLSLGIDWSGGAIWAGAWGASHGPSGWYRPHFSGNHGPPGAQPWHPKGRTSTPASPERGEGSPPVPHPHPIQGAPASPVSPQARNSAQPAGRPATHEARPVPQEPRSGAPEIGRGEREAAPAPAPARQQYAAPARQQYSAPAARSSPAPAQPAQAREAPAPAQGSPNPEPRNH